MTVYADNAATTQMSDSVLKAMMPLLTDIYGNPSSLHSVGQIAKEHLEAARESVAECIGADPKEIYFTSGGSEADNQAIRSAAYIGARKGKKHIISSKFEHHAVLHTCEYLEKNGFEVTYLDVNEEGFIDLEELKNATNYQQFIRIVESLQAAVEKIPIRDAFDELDSERDYYQAKRRESNDRLIAKKARIGKLIGFTPMVVMFVGYLIVPLVVIGLTSMTSSMASLQ